MNNKKTEYSNIEMIPKKSELRDSLLLKVDQELWILKKEITNSLSQPCQPRLLNNPEEFKPHLKRKKSLPIGIEPSKRVKLQQNILLSQKYFIEAYNLPLHYILTNSYKIVFTYEWIEAIKEQENIKILQKIENLRKQNKFIINKKIKWKNEILEIRNSIINQTEKKKKVLKRLAYEILQAHNQNSIYENENICISKCNRIKEEAIFFKKIKAIIEPISSLDNKLESFKKHTNIFNIMKSSTSKANYTIPILRKSSNIHASFVTTVNKISSEMSKLNTPVDFINYFISKRNNVPKEKFIREL